MNRLTGLWLLLSLLSLIPDPARASLGDGKPYEVKMDARGIRVDGEYLLIRGGSVQWFRLPPEVWEDRLRKFKGAGFNTIDMYIAWNQVEPRPGEFRFDAPDIRRFLRLAQEAGLYVTVRPGPYITNEVDGGGLPAWLTRYATKKSYEDDGMVHLRSHDPDFIRAVRRYFHALGEVLQPFLASRGGPVIIYTIENEYNWFERSFKLDKLFWYEGAFERPPLQELPTAPYMQSLLDLVRESGIDVPVTACPGDGKVSAMGDVPGVVPFPNIYEWATPDQPEEAAWKILRDMHDPHKHGGIYVDMPSGSLEVNRSAQEFRRLISGGMDAVYGFNMAGMIQEGYMNSVTLAARAGDQKPHWGVPGEPAPDWLGTIFDFADPALLSTFFLAPDFGYFGNVIDYGGAISPSGVLRDNWYQFRRDNMFFDTMGSDLAAAGEARRSGHRPDAEDLFLVDHPAAGVREAGGQTFYHLDGPSGASWLFLVNQTGQPLVLDEGSISFRGRRFPAYTKMTVPLAREDRPVYTAMLPYAWPASGGWILDYTTSALLTWRPFNGDSLAVFYGRSGTAGELSLQGQGPFRIEGKARIHENRADGLVLSWIHQDGAALRIEDAAGRVLRLVITNHTYAGRFWFFRHGSKDGLIAGPDYVETSSPALAGKPLILPWEFSARTPPIQLLADGELSLQNLAPVAAPGSDGIRRYHPQGAPALPGLPVFSRGKVRADHHEALPEFDDSTWQRWTGEPRALEFLDIFRGRAWYRSEIRLEERPSERGAGLWLDHASDMVGIYVNGNYVSTVSPMGTEINNLSRDKRYRFASLTPFLRPGRNVIAFRTEIWGHGSFMMPRGQLILTKARIPAMGYDGLKGLHGSARLGDEPLNTWSARAGLGGEIAGWQRPDLDDGDWSEQNLPLRPGKGAITWLRTEFATTDLPRPDRHHAPVALELLGRNSKATLYVNGRILGRWLSDSGWLQQGFWGRPQRGMWVGLSADQFPVPRELLRTDGSPNSLVLVLEDTSHSSAAAGELSSLRFVYNEEGLEFSGATMTAAPGVRGRGVLRFGSTAEP